MNPRSSAYTALSLLLGAGLLGACDSEKPRVPDAATDRAATPVSSAEPAARSADADAEAPAAMAPYLMTVYKSPTCGCCTAWVDYMREDGHAIKTVETDAVDAIKAEHGLHAPELKSCHTAIVGGYVIEGHVPAADVRRLLAEKPDIVGLTAPGMPMMSPGMGSLTPKDYDVLAFDESGRTRVWSSY